ncbi:MAG: hypothetical protein WAL94_11305 [Bacteroidales bacterium]
MKSEKIFTTRMAKNPLPYTNITDKRRKTVFAINALKIALNRNESSPSVSFLSFVNTIRARPLMSNNKVSSSRKFVLKEVKYFVARNEE